MNIPRSFVASSVMPIAIVVLLLFILIANAVQIWLVLPFESFGSPDEVLNHAIGLLLFLSAASFAAAQSSKVLPAAVSGLLLVLTIGDVVFDALSSFLGDKVLSLLWLVPGLVMAWSPSTSRCGISRIFFIAGACLQSPGTLGDILYATTAAHSDSWLYQWIDNNGDLLTRSLYLLAFIKLMLPSEGVWVPQDSIATESADARGHIGGRAKAHFSNSGLTPYQRLQSVVSAHKFTAPARMVGIVSSSVEFAYWRLRHPDATFADYYAGQIARHLDRGGGHPTLGKREVFPSSPFAPSTLIDVAEHSRRGCEEFEILLGLGLKPEHVCIDFGCGSLRVGQHLIPYLNAGQYWGLDITDRFYRDGMDLLAAGQIEMKRPNLGVISHETLRMAALANPDFIISFSVLSHVPPAEAGLYFDRILGLMGEKTKLVFSFRESTINFRAAGKAWARDAGSVEELIRCRRPQSDILFHRKPVRKSRFPQWATIAEVS
jgi:hypothetical protein